MSKLNRPALAGFVILTSIVFWGPVLSAQDDVNTEIQEFGNVEDATLDSANTPQDNAAQGSLQPSAEGAEDQLLDHQEADSGQSASEPAKDAVVEEKSSEPEQGSAEQAPVQQESESQSAATESPAPEQAPSEATVKAESVETKSEESVTGTYGGRIFGRKKIQLAANRPTFNEGQKCYEKFYGKPETHISFSGEWFPLDWWVNPGLYTRLGVYSVRGKAISGSPDSTKVASCESLSVDENSSTGLLFVPIQLGAKIQFSPFRRKWLVLDYWTGAELDWWQETRNQSASIVLPAGLLAENKVYTTTGRKRSISAGASVHLLLNPLDERTVRSMIDTMGIGYVYLSGFMETVKSTTKEGLTFGRNVVGLGFTFEAYK